MNFLKALFSKLYFKIFILNIFISFIFFFFFRNNLQFNFKIFIFSSIISLFFWQFIEIISDFIKNKVFRIIYFVLISFLLTFLYVSTFFLFREFQNFINASMLKFISDDHEYFLNYIKVYLFNLNGFLFLIIWIIIFLGLFFRNIFKINKNKKTYKKIIELILLITFILVILNNIKKDVVNRFMCLDSSFLMAIKQVMRMEKQGQKELYTSFNRLEVKRTDKKSDYNILLIINESFNKYGLGIYGKESNYAEFINDYLDYVKDRVAVFYNFYSNASVTDVSIPSIMTGVSPENSLINLHLLPFIWSYARAKGMKSIFVSSQRYNWANFYRFFFGCKGNSPDYYITASDTKEPIVHDCGMDDMVAVEYFKKSLDKIKKDEKFLAIYNSNALHSPYQQVSKYIKNENKSKFRYENAVYILDNACKKIFDFLKERNFLEDTIIIFTGDHSTPLDNKDVRMYSMKKDSVNIPFFIIFPEKFIKEYRDLFDKIKRNEKCLASNIDVVPTIIQILGLDKENEEIMSLLDGRSLFSDIEERNVVILNNTDFRRKDIECFGIYSSSYSFCFITQEKEEYYDLKKDANQKNNIWDTLDEREKQNIFSIINKNKRLSEIYNEGKNN